MRILYEDPHLVVLSKPAGLLSQGDASGDEDLVSQLRVHFGRHYVGLVHRLDRNTSGLMVVAKRSKSAERLTQALQSGKLKRNYQAWLCGELRGPPQRWSHYLIKDEATNTVRIGRAGQAGAKEASLTVTPLSCHRYRGTPISLAKFVLETGRSHQIRVQAAASGFPLVGDRKYATRPEIPDILKDFHRPALHSFEIEFPHPMSHEVMRFEDPLPADLESFREAPTL